MAIRVAVVEADDYNTLKNAAVRRIFEANGFTLYPDMVPRSDVFFDPKFDQKLGSLQRANLAPCINYNLADLPNLLLLDERTSKSGSAVRLVFTVDRKKYKKYYLKEKARAGRKLSKIIRQY